VADISSSDLEKRVSALLDKILDKPELAHDIIARLSKSPEQIVSLLDLPKNRLSEAGPDDEAVKRFADAVTSLAEAATAHAKIKQASGSKYKTLKESGLLDWETLIKGAAAIGTYSFGSGGQVPQSCKAAVANLGRRQRKATDAYVALLGCLVENMGDILTTGELVPDICSWLETSYNAAMQNLKAALRDVSLNCPFV